MHPNAFLRTLWDSEMRPEVFVAMSFADEYRERYEEVIAPAIRQVAVNGVQLEPRRVDETKSGDSILTEIMDGIAHSQFVLADVSSVGRDSKSGQPYRNANVMYEVGIALACRQPCEVLLIRDDRDDFLFDVSTIPHMTLDFTDVSTARERLKDEVAARLNQRQLLHDARLRKALASLTREEFHLLRRPGLGPNHMLAPDVDGDKSNLYWGSLLPRLLDKQIAKLVGASRIGRPVYEFTPFGREVMEQAKSGLTEYALDEESNEDCVHPAGPTDDS